MSNIEIRRANIFDIDEIIHISEIYLKESYYNDVSLSNLARYIKDNFNYFLLEKKLLDEDIYYYALSLNNRIVGYYRLNDLDKKTIIEQSDYLQLQYLFILSEHQEESLYKEIFDKINNFAHSYKRDFVFTNLRENQTYLINLYKDNFYEQFDTCDIFIGSQKVKNILLRRKVNN